MPSDTKVYNEIKINRTSSLRVRHKKKSLDSFRGNKEELKFLSNSTLSLESNFRKLNVPYSKTDNE